MAKPTITRNEYLQIEGLAALGGVASKRANECSAAMAALLDVDVDDGDTWEVVAGDSDVTSLLERLKITVVD